MFQHHDRVQYHIVVVVVSFFAHAGGVFFVYLGERGRFFHIKIVGEVSGAVVVFGGHDFFPLGKRSG